MSDDWWEDDDTPHSVTIAKTPGTAVVHSPVVATSQSAPEKDSDDGDWDDDWGDDDASHEPLDISDWDEVPAPAAHTVEPPVFYEAAHVAGFMRRRRVPRAAQKLGTLTRRDPVVSSVRGVPSRRGRYMPAVIDRDGSLPEGCSYLKDLPSRVPRLDLRAGARRDLYWSGDFGRGEKSLDWQSVGSLLQNASYYGLDPMWQNGLTPRPDVAAENLTAERGHDARISVLGALDQWRSMTSEQLATMTGYSLHGLSEDVVLPALHDSGLIEYGRFQSELSMKTSDRRNAHLPVFRPGRAKTFEKKIIPQLTYAEIVAVTGGLPPSHDKRYSRHNVLATEFALRASEFCPEVATVVGEKLSYANRLVEGCQSLAAGDFTIVRSDGLRIVVEMTNSVGRTFEEKVERWMRLLDTRAGSLSASGIVVLYVDSSRPETDKMRGESVMKKMRGAVARYSNMFPGAVGRRIAERMFIASWADFFPGPEMLHERFLTLNALAPTGRADEGRVWEPYSLLDPSSVPLDAAPESRLTDVIGASKILAGTPYWMRAGCPLQVWNATLDDVGIGQIPSMVRGAGVDAPPSVVQGLGVVPLAPQRTRGLAKPVHGWRLFQRDGVKP